MNPIEEMVRNARKPVALTGAGISAPSGIPTFQGSWKGRPIRDFLSRDFRNRREKDFFELFVEMVGWCDKEPNEAHRALAALDIPVITQNIDGLHEKAGTRRVFPLHGTLHTVHCTRCGNIEPARAFAGRLAPLYACNDTKEISKQLLCPHCGGRMDTDVVLYGDNVQHLDEAIELSEQADLMLVIGTSLTTYPAAAMPEIAEAHGAKIVLINEDCISALEGIVK